MKNTRLNAATAARNGFTMITGVITSAFACPGVKPTDGGKRHSVINLSVFDAKSGHSHRVTINKDAFGPVFATADASIRDNANAIFESVRRIVDNNQRKADARKAIEKKEEELWNKAMNGENIDIEKMQNFAEKMILRKYDVNDTVEEREIDRKIVALQGQHILLWKREKKDGVTYRTIEGTNPYTASKDSVEIVPDSIDNEAIDFQFDLSSLTADDEPAAPATTDTPELP